MNAEKVLSNLNYLQATYPNYAEVFDDPDYLAMVQSLKEEVALSAARSAGRASRFKAALKFSKQCFNMHKDTRPGFAGAYIDEKGRQCICDGYTAVMYEKPFAELVEADKDCAHMNLDKSFDYDSRRPVDLPTLAELKTKKKLDKAEGKKRSLTVIGGHVCYNTDFLIQLVEMVEPTEAYFSGGDRLPALVAIGDGAKGIVLPVNKPKEEAE